MSCRGVVNHGLVLVGQGYILVCEGPAGGFYAGLGGSGGSIGVEVVRIGEVGSGDGRASGGTQLEGDVVDVVAAESLVDPCREDIAESDVSAVAGVVLEADGAEDGS